jgi:hypothetical protein
MVAYEQGIEMISSSGIVRVSCSCFELLEKRVPNGNRKVLDFPVVDQLTRSDQCSSTLNGKLNLPSY